MSLHVQKLVLLLQLCGNCGSGIFELLEQIVIVMNLLCQFDIVARHSVLVKRVYHQFLPDFFGERTVGKDDIAGHFVQPGGTGSLVKNPSLIVADEHFFITIFRFLHTELDLIFCIGGQFMVFTVELDIVEVLACEGGF